MPLIAPVLDDRDFEALFAELRDRIPVYNPGWTLPVARSGRSLTTMSQRPSVNKRTGHGHVWDAVAGLHGLTRSRRIMA